MFSGVNIIESRVIVLCKKLARFIQKLPIFSLDKTKKSFFKRQSVTLTSGKLLNQLALKDKSPRKIVTHPSKLVDKEFSDISIIISEFGKNVSFGFLAILPKLKVKKLS